MTVKPIEAAAHAVALMTALAFAGAHPWWAAACVRLSLAAWLWRRHREARPERNRWPTVTGHVEFAEVTDTSFEDRRASLAEPYFLHLSYSFQARGEWHSGEVEQHFGSEDEAQEAARAWRGTPLQVRYNPAAPAESVAVLPLQ